MRDGVPHHAPRSASLLAGLGGLALVGSVLLPIARVGVGSATPLRGLSDLILAGALRAHVPTWVGVIGYLPAIAGAFVLLAEPLPVRTRVWLRGVAVSIAAACVGALLWLVPWGSATDLGPGLQLGAAGVALSFAAAVADDTSRRHARRAGRPPRAGTPHPSPLEPPGTATPPSPPTTTPPMNRRRHHVLPAVRH